MHLDLPSSLQGIVQSLSVMHASMASSIVTLFLLILLQLMYPILILEIVSPVISLRVLPLVLYLLTEALQVHQNTMLAPFLSTMLATTFTLCLMYLLMFRRLFKPNTHLSYIFTSKDFCTHCTHQRQRLTFCGVNAHHQNGITERHIRSITERACSMLIHAMISWPDIISEQLWPFALQLAMDLHNHTPGSSGLSPLEIISGVKSLSPTIRDFHPFGCPIFVLHPSLQQGHKIPRWKPRSRVGVYLGFSPNHASSVPLVSSTTTGLVSPHSMSSTTIFLQQQIVFRPIPFPILGLHY